MFTTQRLRLRAYKSGDFQPLYDLYNTFGNMNWLQSEAFPGPVTEDHFKNVALKFFQSGLMFCIIEELETEAFVGFVILFGMQPKNRCSMFGISLHPDFQSKGYGKEVTQFTIDYAFCNLGLHRVTLTVYSGNDRAIAAYEKAGFVREGVTRKAAWINGEWYDEIRMGILEEEWRARKPGEKPIEV